MDSKRKKVELPKRFDVAPENDFCAQLPHDAWSAIYASLPLIFQFPTQFISRSFYNTYWETRSEFAFSPELSKASFEKINDKTLGNLLSKCDQRYFISLTLNFCSSVTPVGLEHVWELKSLQRLNLYCCYKVTSGMLANISCLENLRDLNIAGCQLVGKHGLNHIAKLTQLESLNLSGLTQISTLEDIPKTLTNLTHLDVQESSLIAIQTPPDSIILYEYEKPPISFGNLGISLSSLHLPCAHQFHNELPIVLSSELSKLTRLCIQQDSVITRFVENLTLPRLSILKIVPPLSMEQIPFKFGVRHSGVEVC